MLGFEIASALSDTIPAPVFGWNTRLPLDGMDPRFALVLDNWFCDESSIRLRRGFSEYADGLGGPTETLVEHVSAAGAHTFLSAANGNLYNVSTSTESSLGSGFSSNRWQSVTMNNIRLLFNGTDQPKQWNGSALSDATYSGGLADNDIVQACVYRGRIFACLNGSSSIWYGALRAVTGAMTEFPVGYELVLGGYPMFVTTWSRSTGNYLSELLVIVSSEGEVLIYGGSSPDEGTFTLVSHRFISPPFGRRSFLNINSNVEILTHTGVVSLADVVDNPVSAEADAALTGNISPTWAVAANSYRGNFGWEAVRYPLGKQILYNIPISSEVSHQYVRNMFTGAWCRFLGMNASCFGTYNRQLYFGSPDGEIFLADSGMTDNDASISVAVKCAFNYHADRDHTKKFTLVRPLLTANGEVEFDIGIDVDFESKELVNTASTLEGAGAEWDVADWDVEEWAGDVQSVSKWVGVTGLGRCEALKIEGEFQNIELAMTACQIIYEPGGYL